MADKHIRLEVVTPARIVVDEAVQIVMAPGVLGEFGVLTGHTPFLTTLKVGMLHYNDAGGTKRYVFVNGGFAEALPDKLTVLAESAERRQNIDKERAQAALDRAEERLSKVAEEKDIDYLRAKAALERAINRLRTIDTKS
jgi:F-type H+-transporting ATPase subunit epsilon